MTVLQSFILGLIQALTEFLPVSSSAHLNIFPWIFNWDMPESFDVALHLGTLLAIGVYFFKEWIRLISLMHSALADLIKNIKENMRLRRPFF